MFASVCRSEKIRKNGHAENGDQRAKCLECGRTFVLQPKGERLRPEVQGSGGGRLPGPDEHPGDYPHLWRLLPDGAALGGGKKRPFFRPSWKRSCPLKIATCLNSTNFGASWAAKPANFGFGWPSAGRTRQIVGWTLADRSQQSACDLRASLPRDYRGCATRSDFWGSLCGGLSRGKSPCLWQRGRRNQPRRTLVWHPAGAAEPPWCVGLTPSPGTPRTTSMPSTSSSPPTTLPFNIKQRLGNHHPYWKLDQRHRRNYGRQAERWIVMEGNSPCKASFSAGLIGRNCSIIRNESDRTNFRVGANNARFSNFALPI